MISRRAGDAERARSAWSGTAKLAMLALFSGLIASACGSDSIDLAKCGDANVQCVDVVNTSSKVIYTCNLHIADFTLSALAGGSDHTADIPVCLPANLNRWIATPDVQKTIDGMSQHDYDVAISDYGRQVVLQQLIELGAVDGNGKQCSNLTKILADSQTGCVVKAGRSRFVLRERQELRTSRVRPQRLPQYVRGRKGRPTRVCMQHDRVELG